MNKKYTVRLSDEERQTCQLVVKKLKGSSQRVRRAQSLCRYAADPRAVTHQTGSYANCRLYFRRDPNWPVSALPRASKETGAIPHVPTSESV